MRLPKPWCCWRRTTAATSRESNCSWMVDSRKCRVIRSSHRDLQIIEAALAESNGKSCWARWCRCQNWNSAVDARYENQTTQDKEIQPRVRSLFQLPEIQHFPQIASRDFPFRALFSVRSNWLLDCTSRDRCSNRWNAVHSRVEEAF